MASDDPPFKPGASLTFGKVRRKTSSKPEDAPPELPTWELQEGYRILQELMKVSKCFLEAPDAMEKGMGDYFEVIEKPMWFLEMKRKFEEKEYTQLSEFVSDVRLMLLNCYRYFGPHAYYTKRALSVENRLEQKLVLLPVELLNKCTLEATNGPMEDVEEAGAEVQSRLLHSVKTDRIQREKERRQKLADERKAEEEGKNSEVLQWEREVLFQGDAREIMASMWELPVIGHFVLLGLEHLNIEEIPQFEIERIFLMPQASRSLSIIMTTLLSPPMMRMKLSTKPPMPYKIWTKKLRHKVVHWYKTYAKSNNNADLMFEKFGIEHQFWKILGNEYPLEEYEFHELTFHQRVWLIKTLCDYLLQHQRSLRDLLSSQPEEFGNCLGMDRLGAKFLYFRQFFGQDVRVYRQAPDPPSWIERDLEYQAELEATSTSDGPPKIKKTKRKKKKGRGTVPGKASEGRNSTSNTGKIIQKGWKHGKLKQLNESPLPSSQINNDSAPVLTNSETGELEQPDLDLPPPVLYKESSSSKTSSPNSPVNGDKESNVHNELEQSDTDNKVKDKEKCDIINKVEDKVNSDKCVNGVDAKQNVIDVDQLKAEWTEELVGSEVNKKSDPQETKSDPQTDLVDTKSDPQTEVADTKSDLQSDIADTKSDPQTDVADTKSDPQTDVADINSDPQTVVADTKNDPQTDVADINSDPQTVVADTKNDPQTDVADINSDPQTVVADTKNDPQTDVADTKSDPQTDVADTKSDPQTDVADTKSDPQTNVADAKEVEIKALRKPLYNPHWLRPSPDDFLLVADSVDGLRELLAKYCDDDLELIQRINNAKTGRGSRPSCEIRLAKRLNEFIIELEPCELKSITDTKKCRRKLYDEWYAFQNRPEDYVDADETFWLNEKEPVEVPEETPMEEATNGLPPEQEGAVASQGGEGVEEAANGVLEIAPEEAAADISSDSIGSTRRQRTLRNRRITVSSFLGLWGDKEEESIESESDSDNSDLWQMSKKRRKRKPRLSKVITVEDDETGDGAKPKKLQKKKDKTEDLTSDQDSNVTVIPGSGFEGAFSAWLGDGKKDPESKKSTESHGNSDSSAGKHAASAANVRKKLFNENAKIMSVSTATSNTVSTTVSNTEPSTKVSSSTSIVLKHMAQNFAEPTNPNLSTPSTSTASAKTKTSASKSSTAAVEEVVILSDDSDDEIQFVGVHNPPPTTKKPPRTKLILQHYSSSSLVQRNVPQLATTSLPVLPAGTQLGIVSQTSSLPRIASVESIASPTATARGTQQARRTSVTPQQHSIQSPTAAKPSTNSLLSTPPSKVASPVVVGTIGSSSILLASPNQSSPSTSQRKQRTQSALRSPVTTVVQATPVTLHSPSQVVCTPTQVMRSPQTVTMRSPSQVTVRSPVATMVPAGTDITLQPAPVRSQLEGSSPLPATRFTSPSGRMPNSPTVAPASVGNMAQVAGGTRATLVVVPGDGNTASNYALAFSNGTRMILTPEQVAQIRAENNGVLGTGNLNGIFGQ